MALSEATPPAGPNEAGCPRVQGLCPACGGETLMLGYGGYVTCSLLGCPDPCAADALLHQEADDVAP